ncbi:hypothetical protein AMECASPLE_006099 [Ameca splendens]|uniref:Uncharacterized protein n=1 Tax=Ameca splendens TaxID=208324 RepID=A0ABV1A7S7_9TELE
MPQITTFLSCMKLCPIQIHHLHYPQPTGISPQGSYNIWLLMNDIKSAKYNPLEVSHEPHRKIVGEIQKTYTENYTIEVIFASRVLIKEPGGWGLPDPPNILRYQEQKQVLW